MVSQETWMFDVVTEQVLTQYGIKAKTVNLLSELNEYVFQVVRDDGQTFVLRLQQPDKLSDDAVHAQLNWLKAIHVETDIIVPLPVALTSGKSFGNVELSQLETTCRYVLFNWVEGERKPTPDDWVHPENLNLIGRVVAQLHNHAQNYGMPQEGSVSLLNSQGFLGEGSALKSNEIEPHLGSLELKTFHRYIDTVASVLQEHVEKEDECGLIHADLGPHNWLFDQGVPRIIDFDAFAIGYFVHDLLGVLWSHCHWKANQTYVASLFEGYETVRNISDGVKANVFALQAAHCFMWINWVLSLKPEAQNELIPHIPFQVSIVEQLMTMKQA